MNVRRVTDEFPFNAFQTNSRRSLFPSEGTDSESDSDLGLISPLCFDTSSKTNFKQFCSKQGQNASELIENSVGDYDILEIVNTQIVQEVISPLYCSSYNRTSCLTKTPSKTFSNYILKTPNDTSNTNTKLPKVSLKFLDSSQVSKKKKLSPDNSPEQRKHKKIDSKSSRVRTTLFPDVELALPTKMFYSKAEDLRKIVIKRDNFSSSSVLSNSNRKPRLRKKVGQINAGVCHKIRKPKQKKLNKTIAKTISNSETVGSSSITNYLTDIKLLQGRNKENKDPFLSSAKQIVPAIMHVKTETAKSKKRQFSSDFQPDIPKKFFKSSKTKGIVKISKNMQLEVKQGKMSLVENKNVTKINFDSNEFSVDEPTIPEINIDNIISGLDDSVSEGNTIVLRAHNSVIASENSVLHQSHCASDIILSPISQMCDVTSGLALTTPKKIKNLTPILEDINYDATFTKDEQLFSVFYPRAIKIPTKSEKKKNAEKRIKNVVESQMLLDVGQKKFGFTECHECNLVYHMGDPSEEIMHNKYHSGQHVLKFPGWKNERVVSDYQQNGRIIQMVPGDSKTWWKKISDLMDIINQEVGCSMDFCLQNCQVFLYIKQKTIKGCLVAIAKSEGYKLISSDNGEVDICSEASYPVKCGIQRIWVSPKNRQQGIATKLMNTLKKNFILGYNLDNFDIAFSSPTEAGKKFGQSYFKTNGFYIY